MFHRGCNNSGLQTVKHSVQNIIVTRMFFVNKGSYNILLHLSVERSCVCQQFDKNESDVPWQLRN